MTTKKQEQDSWHLSKTVNISHLVTTVVLVVGMVSYIGDIERAVAVQQAEIANIKAKIVEHKGSDDDALTRIDKKLDRLFELVAQVRGK